MLRYESKITPAEIKAAREMGELWTDCYDDDGMNYIIVNNHCLGYEYLLNLSDDECEVIDDIFYDLHGPLSKTEAYNAIEDFVDGLSDGEVERSLMNRDRLKDNLRSYWAFRAGEEIE